MAALAESWWHVLVPKVGRKKSSSAGRMGMVHRFLEGIVSQISESIEKLTANQAGSRRVGVP